MQKKCFTDNSIDTPTENFFDRSEQVHIGIKGLVTDMERNPIANAVIRVTGPSIAHDVTTGKTPPAAGEGVSMFICNPLRGGAVLS